MGRNAPDAGDGDGVERNGARDGGRGGTRRRLRWGGARRRPEMEGEVAREVSVFGEDEWTEGAGSYGFPCPHHTATDPGGSGDLIPRGRSVRAYR